MTVRAESEHDPVIFEPRYYERLHDIEERHWWAVGMRRVMAALLAPVTRGRRGVRVVDAGCGTGFLLREISSTMNLEGEPFGVDLSIDALLFSRGRGARAIANGTAMQLPARDASFDLAICIDTLQHVSPAGADAALVRELARVLAPGGVLYLRTNSATGRRKRPDVDANEYRRYTTREVSGMMREAGFEVVRATYVNAFASIPAVMREFLFPPKPHHHGHVPGLAIRNFPPHLRWLNSILLQVMRFEAFLIARGIDLPFGHSSAFVGIRK